MWTLEALRQHREAILDVARQRGVRGVRVFGSVSRGEATASSDVDFLVKVEPGRRLSDRGLRPRFRERVTQEAVAL